MHLLLSLIHLFFACCYSISLSRSRSVPVSPGYCGYNVVQDCVCVCFCIPLFGHFATIRILNIRMWHLFIRNIERQECRQFQITCASYVEKVAPSAWHWCLGFWIIIIIIYCPSVECQHQTMSTPLRFPPPHTFIRIYCHWNRSSVMMMTMSLWRWQHFTSWSSSDSINSAVYYKWDEEPRILRHVECVAALFHLSNMKNINQQQWIVVRQRLPNLIRWAQTLCSLVALSIVRFLCFPTFVSRTFS